MNSKTRTIEIMFVLFLASTLNNIFIRTPTPAASPTTTISVEPPSIIDETLVPGSTFTIDVNITDVLDLYGYEFKLRYDTSVLTAMDMAPHEGTTDEPGFIFTDYMIWWWEVKDERGFVWISVTPAFWITEGVDGSGRLATITFKVDAVGETILNIDETSLGDSTGGSITHDVIDGYFRNTVVTYTLTVNSDPISGVQFTVDGTTHTTPWSGSLSTGSHTIVMPATWTVGADIYNFDHWEDSSTSPTRTISLTSDKTVTASYVLAPKKWTLTVNSSPIIGVQFTVDGTTHTTPWSGSLSEGSHIIVMPSSWGIYSFDHWEDTSKNPTRTVSLTADKTVTAYYVKRQWTLNVNSDPFAGVEFTLNGVPHTTPWSSLLDEGSYTIVMPSTWTVGADIYNFDHWEDTSTTPTRTISLTSHKTVTAYYVLALKRYKLVIGVVGSGTTVPSPETYIFDAGTKVTVAAIPDPGWMADHWELDGVNVGDSDPYTVTMNKDHTLIAFFLKTHQLTVNSAPISGVEFTLDGIKHSTPYSESLKEGSHTIVMPSTWTIGANVYNFDHWEDTSTTPTRTISLTSDKTLTAYYKYVPKTYTLTVNSNPITGVEFTINGATHTTPWSGSLTEGTYTIVMPSTWTVGSDIYNFDHWEDTSTDRTRVITLAADMTLTAYYVLMPKYWTLTVYSVPISGVEFTLDGVKHATPYSESLIEGSHTVVMPSTWTVGTDVYKFDHWEDDSTNPTRTIPLATDMAVTAYYVLPLERYELVISVVGSGTTDPAPGAHTFDEGTEVVVDVLPASGWMLDHWELDGVDVGDADPYTVTMDADHTLTALFVEIPIPKTLLSVDPESIVDPSLTPGSTFTLNITVVDVTDLYGFDFTLGYDTTVLTATKVAVGDFFPDFFIWKKVIDDTAGMVRFLVTRALGAEGGISGSGTIAVVTFTTDAEGETVLDLHDTELNDSFGVSIAHDVVDGYFNNLPPVTQYVLTIDVVGSGTTDPAPGAHTFDEGTEVVVDVLPASGWMLDHWELDGVDVGDADPYTVTMDADHTLTALFVEIPPTLYELTVYSDPITGVEFTLDGIKHTTPYSESLIEGSHTIVMPSTWTVGIDVYKFDHWEDASTDPTRVITLIADKTVTAYYVLAPKYWTLTVKSDPISGVEFTLDGIKHSTSYSESLVEGSHTIVMPSSWGIYSFDHWEDNSTSPTRTISLTADKTVTAYYVKRRWTLNVNSDPFTGVEFTLNGAPHTTPWSSLLDEGSYTIVMPSTWTVGANVYKFDHWEDTSTSPTRVITLIADKTVTAYYVLVPKKWILTVKSDPISGVEFTLDGVKHTTSYSESLFEGAHTVVMPPTWTVGTDVYNFDHWEDLSTNPTRTISLTADKTVTAYYVRMIKRWTLTVKSVPISGVEFTLDGVKHSTSYSESLVEGSHTIVMPSTWTVGADVYKFDHWEDTSTDPTRVITLIADKTVTAYYILPTGDVTPPTITIKEPTARKYLHSEVITLDFSAVDTESGVAWISATLNGMTVKRGESIELFTLSLGRHTLSVTAVDNAGNSATKTVEFNVIATVGSLIDLVEKFYKLGYIDDKDVKVGLLDKLYAACNKLQAGQPKVAKNILSAFINQVKAQSGKHITVEAAKILITDAQYIIDNL